MNWLRLQLSNTNYPIRANYQGVALSSEHISRGRLLAARGIGLPSLPGSHTPCRNRNNMHKLSEDRKARDTVGPVAVTDVSFAK